MKSTPLVVEIIGPCGAGKSALSGALNDCGRKVRAGVTVWGLPLPLLLIGAFLALPTLFSLCAGRGRFRFDEIKQVIRLNAFYRRLKKEIEAAETSSEAALFLDEGAVFALAKLRADRAADENADVRLIKKWEQNALSRCSEMVDAVVWLDASDELLAERIRTRAKRHRIKHKSNEEVNEFLARYRASYEHILSGLQTCGGLRVIRFQTDHTPPEAIVDEIFKLIRRKEQADSGLCLEK